MHLKLLLLLLLQLILYRPAVGLFLHTSSAIVRSPPTMPAAPPVRSLFGYRVAVVRDNDDGQFHLLVTDPAGYHSDTGLTSGTAHRCAISAADFNTSAEICGGSGLPFSFAPPQSEARSGFANFSQFGASLASLPDGQFVVCAPGYNFASPAFNLTATPGLCGYWRSPSSQPVWLHKFFPYLAGSRDERMFGNCLGGFQATLTSTVGGDTQLTVSGPFCMLQRLAFVVDVDASNNRSVASNNRWDVYNSSKLATFKNPSNNYLGYSMAADADSGNIYATSPIIQESSRLLLARLRSGEIEADSIDVQIGRPFYDHLYRAFNYIGYSSAVIRTRRSSMEPKQKALLLGAPFQSDGVGTDGLDRGCVFVLPLEGTSGDPINSVSSTPARYCGTEPGGRLGTDVIGIGDVNYDDIEDFAVGCPGCGVNGSGSIYLFLGLSNYANPTAQLEPFEIVGAADLKGLAPKLSGFGWSLALAPDMDGNTVSELVVGAVASRHAVVLPGRLLLVTEIDYSYEKATAEDMFDPDTPIHRFSRRLARPVVATIRMHTRPGVDLSDYKFNLRVRPEELVSTEQQRRFLIELTDCPSAVDGWCQLTRAPGPTANLIQFSLTFRLRPLLNGRRHSSPEDMLRDLSLLMRWNISDRSIAAGRPAGLFPAVLYGRRVFPGYEDAFLTTLYRFKTGVCGSNFGCNPRGNILMELLSSSSVLLNAYKQLKVKLLVRKVSSDPFYGGTAIRLTPSEGVHVLDSVTLVERHPGKNDTVSEARYWSQHDEILVTEPFPDPPDVMTRVGRGQLEVTLRLNFDGRRTAYRVGFRLLNLLGDIGGFQDFVTYDREPMDNWAELIVNFNTSVNLRLLSATDESAVVDARQSAKEADLWGLSGTTAASVIGPGLQHTFELLASMRPTASIRGIGIAVRVPFVTDRGHLLLYFPKNSMAWSHATETGRAVDKTSHSQYLPGLPFTSDDEEGFVGNFGRECLPLEPELAAMMFRPRLTLLESQHEVNMFNSYSVNASSENATGSHDRHRRSSPDDTSPTSQPATSTSPTLPPEPTFDCDRPELAPLPFRCVTFNCPVRELGRDGTRVVDRIFLHLHARLWSPTFFRHHLGRFNIRSSVRLTLPPAEMSAFRHVVVAGNSSVLQTFLFLNVRPPMVDRIPWGYIILAIFLGIWLLLLLILLLWYCNFFRRKTPQDYNSVPQKDGNDDDFYR